MIRPATLEDAVHIAAVHVQSWQETYQHMLYPEVLSECDLEKRLTLWQQVLTMSNHIVLVDEAQGKIQAFIDVCLNEDKGIAKIMALYVLQARQKQGIGRALFEQALCDVHPMQYPQILLNVYDQNPACQFYQHLGAVCIASEDASAEGKDLKVLHYLWERDAFLALPNLV